jgi:hypothetical protein
VEAPIPVILWDKLEIFIDALKYIKGLSADTVIASHSGIVDEKLIDENIEYVRKLSQDKEISFVDNESAENRHKSNKKSLLMLKFESVAQKELGDKFNYKTFKRDYWKQLGIEYQDLSNEYKHTLETDDKDLEKAFEKYLDEIK